MGNAPIIGKVTALQNLPASLFFFSLSLSYVPLLLHSTASDSFPIQESALAELISGFPASSSPPTPSPPLPSREPGVMDEGWGQPQFVTVSWLHCMKMLLNDDAVKQNVQL